MMMLILQQQIGLKYEVKQIKKDNFVSNNNRVAKFDNAFQANSALGNVVQCTEIFK